MSTPSTPPQPPVPPEPRPAVESLDAPGPHAVAEPPRPPGDPEPPMPRERAKSLPDHILETFYKKWPALRADPDALARRLARRRCAQLNRPPRAHCIALRASDTRIHPNVLSFVDLGFFDHERHDLYLYGDQVNPLLKLVQLHPCGESWLTVADKLGVHENALRYLRRRGFFRVEVVKGFAGQPGRGKPMLYYDGWLDPCSQSFRCTEGIWGSLHHYRALPRDFEQRVTREPRYRKSRRYCSVFCGWDWRCPLCSRRTHTLYYPEAVPNVEQYLRIQASSRPEDVLPEPRPIFACHDCHNIRFHTRTDREGWNQLVSYLTCGLLYGHEVPKPAWWFNRRRAYRPSLMRTPSQRRPQVLSRILNGWTFDQIAADMGLKKTTVYDMANTIYRQENVHGRRGLIAKLGSPHPQPYWPTPKRDAVATLLDQGLRPAQIAKGTGLTVTAVYHHVKKIRKQRAIAAAAATVDSASSWLASQTPNA